MNSSSGSLSQPSQFVCTGSTTPRSMSGMLFFDDFSYQADRNDIDARADFMNHNWTGIKSVQTDPGRNPRGHLYTENGWLAMESHANTFSNQTDFWLQMGQESSSYSTANLNSIPGRVEFEFDYIVDPESVFDRHDKFFYPGRGPYPQTAVTTCTSFNADGTCAVRSPVLDAQGNQIHTYLWLLGTSTGSAITNGRPSIEMGVGALLTFMMRPPHAVYLGTANFPVASIDQNKLGPNLVDVDCAIGMSATDCENTRRVSIRRAFLEPGRVHQVRMRVDTSTQYGSFEMWINGIKTHEWIDSRQAGRGGVGTPNFTWLIPTSMVGGHGIMRIPTTLSGGESKYCIDNFSMGTY